MSETSKAPPTYAIIRLRPTDDALALFRLLLDEGYQEIRFVNRLQQILNEQQMSDAATQTEKTQPSNFNRHNATDEYQPPPQASLTRHATVNGGGAKVKLEPNNHYHQAMASAFENHRSAVLPPLSNNSPNPSHNSVFSTSSLLGMNPDLIAPLASALSGLPFLKGLAYPPQAASLGLFPPADIHNLPSIFRSSLQNSAPPSPLTIGFPNLPTSIPDPFCLLSNSLPPHPPIPKLPDQIPIMQSTTEPTTGLSPQYSTALSSSLMLNAMTNNLNPSLSVEPPPCVQTGGGGSSSESYIEAVSPAPDSVSPDINCKDNTSNSVQLAQGKVTVRPRGRISSTEDPMYATCNLCRNRIMCSRVSNLTNHVRRHAALKQFQCCYCEYSHNEMAKVRLHMLHNHKDSESQPVNNITPEMKVSWDMLMEQCFPDHWKPRKRTAASLQLNEFGEEVEDDIGDNNDNEDMLQLKNEHLHNDQLDSAAWDNDSSAVDNNISERHSSTTPVSQRNNHIKQEPIEEIMQLVSAASCPKVKRMRTITDGGGESTLSGNSEMPVATLPNTYDQSDDSMMTQANDQSGTTGGIPLGLVSENDHFRPGPNSRFVKCSLCQEAVNIKGRARHVRKRHLPEQPYACSLCGYEQAEHNKVNLHIQLKHRNDPSAQVDVRNFDQLVEQLIESCFGRIRQLATAENSCGHSGATSPALSEPQRGGEEYENHIPLPTTTEAVTNPSGKTELNIYNNHQAASGVAGGN